MSGGHYDADLWKGVRSCGLRTTLQSHGLHPECSAGESPRPLVCFVRIGSEVHIHWDNHIRTIDGKPAWTGTSAEGQPVGGSALDCAKWKSTTIVGGGRIGNPNAAVPNKTWAVGAAGGIGQAMQSCDMTAGFYCFEKP
jgi:hypothetical protein